MSVEKPLNIRVAEALGCKPVFVGRPDRYESRVPFWRCGCSSEDHASTNERGPQGEILPYGEYSPEGWACTGPLMQRFGINVEVSDVVSETGLPGSWQSVWPWQPSETCRTEWAFGNSVPEAVANLIVALAEAGRLPK